MSDAPEITAETTLDASLFEGDAGAAFGETKPQNFGELFALAGKGASYKPQEFGLDTPITLEMVPEKLRPSIEAKKIQTLEGLFDNYGALESKIGMDTVKAPVAGATPEFLAEHKEALGVPPEPSGYEYERPELPDGVEWDEKGEEAVRKWAHERNLPPELFKDAMDFAVEQRMAQGTQTAEQVSANNEKFQEALAKEWGGDKARNIEIAQNAVAALGLGDVMVKGEGGAQVPLLDKIDAELGSPGVMQLMKAIGEKMKGAELITGDGAALTKTKQQAKQAVDALKADEAFMKQLNTAGAPGHAEAVKKWDEAQRLAHE